jgi:hypothetical protein
MNTDLPRKLPDGLSSPARLSSPNFAAADDHRRVMPPQKFRHGLRNSLILLNIALWLLVLLVIGNYFL